MGGSPSRKKKPSNLSFLPRTHNAADEKEITWMERKKGLINDWGESTDVHRPEQYSSVLAIDNGISKRSTSLHHGVS